MKDDDESVAGQKARSRDQLQEPQRRHCIVPRLHRWHLKDSYWRREECCLSAVRGRCVREHGVRAKPFQKRQQSVGQQARRELPRKASDAARDGFPVFRLQEVAVGSADDWLQEPFSEADLHTAV